MRNFCLRVIMIFWVVASLFLLNACSVSQGPSSGDMKSVVTKFFLGYYSYLKDTTVDIDSIEVVQKGNYNKEKNFWPVTLRVKVTVRTSVFTRDESGAASTEWRFFKGKDGNWHGLPLSWWDSYERAGKPGA